MKTFASMALVLVIGALAGLCSWSAEPDQLVPGTINFPGTHVPQVLDVYKVLVQRELITDSRVKQIRARISAKNERAISQQQAAELIEKALLEQAGIVISPLDAKRASVTYNDALPVIANADRETGMTWDVPSTEALGLPMPMRHFRVDTNTFFSNLRSRMKADNHRSEVDLLQDYFVQQGIDVSPPFRILYQGAKGNLIVRPKKEEEREKIERLIAGLQKDK